MTYGKRCGFAIPAQPRSASASDWGPWYWPPTPSCSGGTRSAAIQIVILAHDVWEAMWFRDPGAAQVRFGIGLGTLVLAANTVLLGGYTLGCHSDRDPRS